MMRLKTKITLGLLSIFALTAGLILFLGLRDVGPALLSAEEKAVRNIFQLIDLHVSEAYNSLLDAKIAAITQRKKLLASNMNLATTLFTRLQTSGLDSSRAQKAAISWFVQLNEEENRDWRIIDARSQYLVGPDDQSSEETAFSLRDLSGRPAVEDIATGRTGRDSGFVVFADSRSSRNFLGYFQRYVAWNWTVAQVLEIADIEALADQTQQQVLRRLHDSFAQITLPGHGSVFLFDSHGRLLIKPQQNSAASSAYLSELQEQIIAHLGSKPDSAQSSPVRVHFTDVHQDSSLQVYASYLPMFDSYAAIVIPTSAIVGPVNQLLKRQTLSVCLVFALGLMIAMGFVRRITTPLLGLVATMRQVTLTDNYQLRLLKASNDEIGQLIDGFNQMLSQIDVRDQQLDNYQKYLEKKVSDRTLGLRKNISDLELANQKAEAANRAKSTFLANVTHELRTPMIGVLGMNELLGESFLNAQQRELTTAVSRAGNHLLDIINQILDFSLLESGSFELHYAEVDLQALSEEVVGRFVEKAAEKNLTLVLNISPEAAWRVQSEDRGLRRILENLIDNAVKFTSEGQVVVSLSRRHDGAFIYRIADTGIGINLQEQENIFGVFKQLDDTSARSFAGTGLGLAIVRELVRLMAGEIRVESTPHQGSLFEVVLPLTPLEPVPAFAPTTLLPARACGDRTQAENQINKEDYAQNSQVLVVDDHALTLELIRLSLQKVALRFDEARNAEDVLHAVAHADYQLILMDVNLPGIDGLELTRRLRTQGVKTPICAMTAHDQRFFGERCLQAGMQEFLRKPFRQADLFALLEKYLANPGG